MGRVDPGAAVDHHLALVTGYDADLGESAPQFVGRTEAPRLVDVVDRRGVDRTRDVSGPWIDRLDVTAIPFSRTSIDEQRVTVRYVVDRGDREVPGGQRDRAGARSPALSRRRAQTLGTPGARPPSSRRTSACPAQRSNHHARAAARLPESS